MEIENKIKCVLIDFEQGEITLSEATNTILRLFNVSGQSEQLCQWHDWIKHPTHSKIGAMICRKCRTILA